MYSYQYWPIFNILLLILAIASPVATGGALFPG